MITDWTARTQATTRANATRNGEGWTSRDLEFVTTFAGEVTDAELALALHRTLYSVQTIKKAIEAGRAGSTRVAPAPRRERRYDPRDFDWSD